MKQDLAYFAPAFGFLGALLGLAVLCVYGVSLG